MDFLPARIVITLKSEISLSIGAVLQKIASMPERMGLQDADLTAEPLLFDSQEFDAAQLAVARRLARLDKT